VTFSDAREESPCPRSFWGIRRDLSAGYSEGRAPKPNPHGGHLITCAKDLSRLGHPRGSHRDGGRRRLPAGADARHGCLRERRGRPHGPRADPDRADGGDQGRTYRRDRGGNERARARRCPSDRRCAQVSDAGAHRRALPSAGERGRPPTAAGPGGQRRNLDLEPLRHARPPRPACAHCARLCRGPDDLHQRAIHLRRPELAAGRRRGRAARGGPEASGLRPDQDPWRLLERGLPPADGRLAAGGDQGHRPRASQPRRRAPVRRAPGRPRPCRGVPLRLLLLRRAARTGGG
jgi:hypothetical protein